MNIVFIINNINNNYCYYNKSTYIRNILHAQTGFLYSNDKFPSFWEWFFVGTTIVCLK